MSLIYIIAIFIIISVLFLLYSKFSSPVNTSTYVTKSVTKNMPINIKQYEKIIQEANSPLATTYIPSFIPGVSGTIISPLGIYAHFIFQTMPTKSGKYPIVIKTLSGNDIIGAIRLTLLKKGDMYAGVLTSPDLDKSRLGNLKGTIIIPPNAPKYPVLAGSFNVTSLSWPFTISYMIK